MVVEKGRQFRMLFKKSSVPEIFGKLFGDLFETLFRLLYLCQLLLYRLPHAYTGFEERLLGEHLYAYSLPDDPFSGIRLYLAADDFHKGALAAAVSTDDYDSLIFINMKVDSFENYLRFKLFVNIEQVNECHGSLFLQR